MGDVDVPPQPLTTPQPPFPAGAEERGLEAEVSLSLIIEADGRVSEARATCQACDPGFLRVTRDTARTWRFAPAKLHGQPVRVQVTQRIHFELDE